MNKFTIVVLGLLTGVSAAVLAEDARNSAFFDALKRRDIDSVKKLVSEGVSVDSRNAEGTPALHAAVEAYGAPIDLEIVEFLVAKGADVNGTTTDGRTALMIAVGSKAIKKDDIVRLLLKHGANVMKETKEGRNALLIARAQGNDYIAELLEAATKAPKTDAQRAG